MAAIGALVILVLLVDLSCGLVAMVMSRCSVPFDGACGFVALHSALAPSICDGGHCVA